MNEPDETPLLLADLASEDVEDRIAVLKVLIEDPSPDERLASALAPLLDDHTACCVMLPPVYGELCWLAAQALARTLSALGRPRAVRVRTIEPIAVGPLGELAERVYGEASIRWSARVKLERLREGGHLPLRDTTFAPDRGGQKR